MRPLAIKLALRDWKGLLSSALGVAVGIGALVFFVGLGLGVDRLLRTRVFPVDTALIEVVPPQLSLGLLGGGRLDEAAVERLQALPGVVGVYRKQALRVPAATIYDGDFFGTRVRMGVEVVAVGVEAALVKGDVRLGDFMDPGPDGPLPALAASRLLEIYNTGFAPSRGLPRVTAELVTGFTFPVQVNRSLVAPVQPGTQVTSVQAQVVGTSDRGVLAGITIPLESARRLNRLHGADAETYTGLAVQAQDPGRVPGLTAAIRAMGLRVDEAERRLAASAGAAVLVATGALGLLAGLICLLAAFNIAHQLTASVRARERELGVMRAVGATRAELASLLLWEAVYLGAAGGLVGLAAALGLAAGLEAVSGAALPAFPFKPEAWFHFPWWLVLGAPLLGVLAAVLGALGPAGAAAAVDPARLLAGER